MVRNPQPERYLFFLILAIVSVVQIAINTGVLACALFLAGDEAFTKEMLLKCLVVTVIAFLVGLLPVVGLLSIFVWFGALMSIFEKEFLEAVIIAIACIAIAWLVGLGLAAVLAALNAAAGVETAGFQTIILS